MKSPPTPRQLQSFALILLAASILLALRLHRHGRALGEVLLAPTLSLVLFAGCWLFPRVVSVLYRAWMALGQALGKVTTPIVLTVVYVLVFVPSRLALYLFRKDPLQLRWDPQAKSYWQTRSKTGFTPEDFERLS